MGQLRCDPRLVQFAPSLISALQGVSPMRALTHAAIALFFSFTPAYAEEIRVLSQNFETNLNCCQTSDPAGIAQQLTDLTEVRASNADAYQQAVDDGQGEHDAFSVTGTSDTDRRVGMLVERVDTTGPAAMVMTRPGSTRLEGRVMRGRATIALRTRCLIRGRRTQAISQVAEIRAAVIYRRLNTGCTKARFGSKLLLTGQMIIGPERRVTAGGLSAPGINGSNRQMEESP